jgi:hypothetical protein
VKYFNCEKSHTEGIFVADVQLAATVLETAPARLF